MFALLQAFGIGEKDARELAYAPIAECPQPRGPIYDRVEGRRKRAGNDTKADVA